MKSLLVVAFFVFSLITLSYGNEQIPRKTSLMPAENKSQAEDIDFLSSKNLFLLRGMPGESCSITDQYGCCSVSCDGKKKAICKPGYTSGTLGFGDGVKIHPPQCFCTG